MGGLPVPWQVLNPFPRSNQLEKLDTLCTQKDIKMSFFIEHNEGQKRVAELMINGDVPAAIDALIRCIGSFYFHPSLLGKSLYLKGFDDLMRQISHRFPYSRSWRIEDSNSSIFVLSEYYAGGGHCLVTEQLMRSCESPVVIVTDFFYNHTNNRNLDHREFESRNPGVKLYFLKNDNFTAKIIEFQEILSTLRPKSVTYLTHHPDPIPYIASFSLPAHVRKIFVHHADHRPALGCTLTDFIHVDLTENVRKVCELQLHRSTEFLPLAVQDHGLKSFTNPTLNSFGVVSAGSSAKYSYSGDLSLKTVVIDFLTKTNCTFHQIGSLPEGFASEIYSELESKKIDLARFRYHGEVKSLWKKLQEIDSHFYIGSFPLNGARGAIEAQGCGYPTYFFLADNSNADLLAPSSVYADAENLWSTTEQLINNIHTSIDQHTQKSIQARNFYLGNFSDTAWKNQFKLIWGDP
jgi:hypothetical protein